MRQELEIEFKNILTKTEFDRMIKHFNITEEQFEVQENHYFDTPNFSLKEKGSALRVREKNGKFTLTLKQPSERGLLESHQILSKVEAEALLNGSGRICGEITNIIEELGVPIQDIQYFGTLKTKRAEISYQDGILVFDQSFYLNKEDYEVEYEVKDEQSGWNIFLELLQSFDIPKRNTENKIKRFYIEKMKHS
jgi:uncharacterized protein YjbK